METRGTRLMPADQQAIAEAVTVGILGALGRLVWFGVILCVIASLGPTVFLLLLAGARGIGTAYTETGEIPWNLIILVEGDGALLRGPVGCHAGPAAPPGARPAGRMTGLLRDLWRVVRLVPRRAPAEHARRRAERLADRRLFSAAQRARWIARRRSEPERGS